MNLDKQIEEILNAVFEHGKQTPDKSYDLPEGQITIAEAMDKIKALILKTCEERVDIVHDKLCGCHSKDCLGDNFYETD